ncbi:MAG: peptidase domain-containing ABC transporter [Pseudomarimonas sp.]
MSPLDLVARAVRSCTRRLPMFQQTQLTECGLACLAMVASYHGHDVDLAGLRRRFPPSIKGVRLSRLIAIADQLDLQPRPLRVELAGLAHLRTPCILHWDMGHFVVLKRVTAGDVEIHDPGRGAMRLTHEQVSRSFTGVALELEPASRFEPIKERRPISWRSLAGSVHGLAQALGLVAVLALALEAFTLVLPLALKLVVDHVVVTGDADLLTLIGVAFLAIVLMQSLTMALRGWVIATLSASINAQWFTNLFAHLLRLPTAYFESRHVGSIMSRFASLASIQRTLTSGFVETVLNGLTVVFVLMVLAFYSASLTAVVLGAFLIYLGLRALAYHQLQTLTEEQLEHAARQQSCLVETVHGAQAIKVANKQAVRVGHVANCTAEVVNRESRIQRTQATFGALSSLVFGGQRVVLIWLGGSLVLAGGWTIGVLVVFLAYAEMFSTRAGALIDRLVEFRLLGVHAERIADIALEPPECNARSGYVGPEPAPTIEVDNLGFRYTEDDPWVIRNVGFTVGAGESVAIVGPSGCGKTTLSKLLLGLIVPTEGTIRVGGIEIQRIGLTRHRERFGAVMQDDDLFAGSVADNIAFFDPEAQLSDIEQAARAASIHDDIVAMPMGYESQVGDMGSALSGGQKQRVLLARALYRKPSILLLDEATSHLDVDRERWINQQVAALRITRIIIAHRPETIASADRVIALQRPMPPAVAAQIQPTPEAVRPARERVSAAN